jgi:glutathione S-transferase
MLDYGHVYGGLDDPEFRAMNQHGRVPVLCDGGAVIWESCAILRYLGAVYGAAPFWPADPAARAQVDMWAEWGKGSFCSDFTAPIFWLRVRTSAKDRDEAVLARGIAAFEARLDVLQAQLEQHDFVVSDDFTLADIVIGHVLFRWFDMDIKRAKRPVVEAYYARLASRPAYRDHVMVSYDMLRAPGA